MTTQSTSSSTDFFRSMSEEDIAQSLRRLRSVFQGNYGHNPIIEDGRPIGRMTMQGNVVHATFRGSVNSAWEIASCINMRKALLGDIGIEGQVHAGIYSAFTKIKKTIADHTTYFSQISQTQPKDLTFIIEGYSRGSGLAILVAAYLAHKFTPDRIGVLTYSSMNILSEQAARDYANKIGKSNHLSFTCREDLVPRLITPGRLGFSSVGEPLLFSANDSPSFEKRVAMREYTYLADQVIIATVVKTVVSASTWEAHMPQTYEEAAPEVFQRYISSKL